MILQLLITKNFPKSGLGKSGRVSDKSIFFTVVSESQGKSWKVKDNVRKSWTELKWSGTILGKWDHLLNFGLVFQKSVYLYSSFLSTVNQGGQHDIAVRRKSIYSVFSDFYNGN